MEPEKRMSGSPGRVGRKKRLLLKEEKAVRYMLRYCGEVREWRRCVLGRYSKRESKELNS